MVLTILILAGWPLGDSERILVKHGSPPAVLAAAAGVKVATCVCGNASAVFVGKGVCVGVSVGGSGVAVGIAASVCATSVNAPATAVFCTSTAAIVGGGGSAPHALTNVAKIIRVKRVLK